MSLRLAHGTAAVRLALALVPLATSLAYTVLVLAMTIHHGRLPRFNDASPPVIGFPLELMFLLGAPSSLALTMGWLVIAPKENDVVSRSLAAWANAVFWVGLASLVLILATDPGDGIEWFMD